jgi:hypothetical protein
VERVKRNTDGTTAASAIKGCVISNASSSAGGTCTRKPQQNKTKYMIVSSTLSLLLIHAIPALDCNSKFGQRQNHTSPGAVSEVTAI